MSVDQPKVKQLCLKSTLLAIAYVVQPTPGWATYADVASMLEAFRPVAPVQSTEINNLIIALDALPAQDRLDALQTLAPSADGSLRAASDGAMRQTLCVISDRLMKVTPQSGIGGGDDKADKPADSDKKDKAASATEDSAADEAQKEDSKATQDATISEPFQSSQSTKPKKVRGAWIQILGSENTQNDRHGVPGYRADVLGAVIGRDILIGQNFTLGLAGAYQHANVTSRNTSGSNLDIKRSQGTLYARYDLDCPFYTVGALTFAGNSYDNNRHIYVPPYAQRPIYNIAHSDFTAWETNFYVETGYIWRSGQFRAIPKLMLMYSHFNVENYIEHDAYGLDLNVKYDSMDSLPLGAGIKLDYINEFENAYVVPEIHLYGFTDSIHDSQQATAAMLGGGYAFLSQGATPANGSIELGGGLAVHSYKNTYFMIQYDYVARSDYHRHQAFIKLRHEWAK